MKETIPFSYYLEKIGREGLKMRKILLGIGGYTVLSFAVIGFKYIYERLVNNNV